MFINLSPSCTDGKYPGKKSAMMLHMAFKIARLMAPSVIHIDDMERVHFSTYTGFSTNLGLAKIHMTLKGLLKVKNAFVDFCNGQEEDESV